MNDKSRTGYIYDPIFLKHTQTGHPESDKRLEAIMDELNTSGLINSLLKIPCREATFEELSLVHTDEYINSVQEKCASGGGNLDADTYTTTDSFEAAGKAAGGMINLSMEVITGKLNNAFALVRPPGHHALRFRAMGFCIFSNVALTAKYAIQNSDIERVAIVDIDVHHGNGTQAILEEDGDILYISTHQFPYYPGTGNYTETGRGKGEGATVNFPLSQGVGDNGFKNIYDEVLIPVLKRFNPQLILVSAGYDAHWNDPLAGLGLSLEGYHFISKSLINLADEICGGKIVFALEGGYNLDVLKNGVANTIRALLHQDDFVDPIGKSPYQEPDISEFMKSIKKFHGIV